MPKMIEMIDMKGKAEGGPTEIASPSKPDYPWGLAITLEDATLKALGVDISRFSGGQIVKLVCEAKVTGKAENQDEDGKPDNSLRLQIVKMAKPSIAKGNRMKVGSELIERMRKGGKH